MKRIALIGLAVLAVGGLVSSLAAQESFYDKYLTVADVEKAGSLTGVKIVPRDPSKGAGGDLNFALADGTMTLIASFQRLKPKDYDAYKAQLKSYIKGSAPGIGDDAFNGPPGDYPYFLTFKKGDWVVSLSSFSDMKGGFFFSMEQLSALAQVIIGRL